VAAQLLLACGLDSERAFWLLAVLVRVLLGGTCVRAVYLWCHLPAISVDEPMVHAIMDHYNYS